MDVFEQLQQVTVQAQSENDLPDVLAARLLRIAAEPEHYRSAAAAIADLVLQVAQYDTYAQTGYMGMGVNNAVLDGAIRRIEGAAQATSRQEPRGLRSTQ
jgi:hypothetical protein